MEQHSYIFFIFFCLWIFCPIYALLSYSSEQFVLLQEGTLPVLLTVPHGGTLKIPHTPERIGGIKIPDVFTVELAQAISNALHAFSGHRPYIVAALFSRAYIDANRSEVQAFDQIQFPIIKHTYELYHACIAKYIAHLRNNYAQIPLLFDIHGQDLNIHAIFRGTQNGLSAQKLIKTLGWASFAGAHSVLGHLQSKNYIVIPSIENFQKFEDEHFNGGYTISTYGSHQKHGIDAIQLEVGIAMRATNEKRKQFAHDFAQSILHFYTYYYS